MKKWQVYAYPFLTGFLTVILYYLLQTARNSTFQWPVVIGLFIGITCVQLFLYRRAYKKLQNS
ncbi:hypothetical protein [Halobacillus sp. Marseille-Q1614]|uniref:hypothetical protein n=1 Tax=Halobacillus sp. Marseille-Q1614 TaxID=2709134 RepID=UPI00156F32A7|nr:hypothetical protein [Halobacillus sp. Marseille-Q1614]